MKSIIALDVGTSGMRAVLFDPNGQPVHAASYEYHTVFPKPSYVEQDPQSWVHAAHRVLKDLGLYIQEQAVEVEAISVTSQRASLIPMSREGKPLHDAIMWQDKRTMEICDRLVHEYGLTTLYRKTGLRVNPFFVLNKIIWLRENLPYVFAATDKFIGVQDFVIHALTGEYVTDWTQASRTMLMDLESFAWSDELLEMAGITEDRLCRLVPPGSIAGQLTGSAAAVSGLPEGLPVIVSGGDQQNAAIALGVVKSGIAEANTGTGSFVLSFSDQPVFHENARLLCQASAIAGKWMAEAPIFNTGAIYRWFKEQFCPDVRDEEQPYVLMNEWAAQSPVGSRGVLLLPHFEGSAAPNWNPMAKGLLFNLGLGSTRADVTRAILESIALEIADNLDLMRALIGNISEISVAGGMVRSDLFCQMQADAGQATVRRTSNPEASALGACLNAWVGLGRFDSHEEALKKVQTEAEYFQPIAEHVAVYRIIDERKAALYRALDEQDVYEKFMFIDH